MKPIQLGLFQSSGKTNWLAPKSKPPVLTSQGWIQEYTGLKITGDYQSDCQFMLEVKKGIEKGLDAIPYDSVLRKYVDDIQIPEYTSAYMSEYAQELLLYVYRSCVYENIRGMRGCPGIEPGLFSRLADYASDLTFSYLCFIYMGDANKIPLGPNLKCPEEIQNNTPSFHEIFPARADLVRQHRQFLHDRFDSEGLIDNCFAEANYAVQKKQQIVNPSNSLMALMQHAQANPNSPEATMEGDFTIDMDKLERMERWSDDSVKEAREQYYRDAEKRLEMQAKGKQAREQQNSNLQGADGTVLNPSVLERVSQNPNTQQTFEDTLPETVYDQEVVNSQEVDFLPEFQYKEEDKMYQSQPYNNPVQQDIFNQTGRVTLQDGRTINLANGSKLLVDYRGVPVLRADNNPIAVPTHQLDCRNVQIALGDNNQPMFDQEGMPHIYMNSTNGGIIPIPLSPSQQKQAQFMKQQQQGGVPQQPQPQPSYGYPQQQQPPSYGQPQQPQSNGYYDNTNAHLQTGYGTAQPNSAPPANDPWAHIKQAMPDANQNSGQNNGQQELVDDPTLPIWKRPIPVPDYTKSRQEQIEEKEKESSLHEDGIPKFVPPMFIPGNDQEAEPEEVIVPAAKKPEPEKSVSIDDFLNEDDLATDPAEKPVKTVATMQKVSLGKECFEVITEDDETLIACTREDALLLPIKCNSFEGKLNYDARKFQSLIAMDETGLIHELIVNKENFMDRSKHDPYYLDRNKGDVSAAVVYTVDLGPEGMPKSKVDVDNTVNLESDEIESVVAIALNRFKESERPAVVPTKHRHIIPGVSVNREKFLAVKESLEENDEKSRCFVEAVALMDELGKDSIPLRDHVDGILSTWWEQALTGRLSKSFPGVYVKQLYKPETVREMFAFLREEGVLNEALEKFNRDFPSLLNTDMIYMGEDDIYTGICHGDVFDNELDELGLGGTEEHPNEARDFFNAQKELNVVHTLSCRTLVAKDINGKLDIGEVSPRLQPAYYGAINAAFEEAQKLEDEEVFVISLINKFGQMVTVSRDRYELGDRYFVTSVMQ